MHENRAEAPLPEVAAADKEIPLDPFAAVARESGFNSANRLAHLFKDKVGMSLGEYARLQERRDGQKRSARATATERKIASA